MSTTQDPTAEMPTLSAPSDEVRRRIESFGVSHTGHRRPTNEDHFVIASLQRSVQLRQTNLEARALFARLCGPMAYLYAVADGVGGSADGRIASSMAVETIVEYLSQTVGSYHAVQPGQEHAFLDPLNLAVQRAHTTLLDTFRAQGHGGGPATTLTIALVVWPRTFIVHVGDRRAYRLHDGDLQRLTRDQTMGAYLVEQRAISEEQAARGGLNDVLSSAIGASDMTPAVGVVDLAPGDTLLLCTDGLTNEVPEATIVETLGRYPDAEASCRALLDLALAAGARDNVTAIVVRALEG